MARALVTGGAGFMGSHLVDYLIDQMGVETWVLDDLSSGFEHNLHSGAHFVRGSIVDHELVDRLFAAQRFDTVYHLAAYAAEGLSHFIKRFIYTNNLVGSVNLINAAVNTGVDCFVFTSSIAVYGTNRVPMHEGLEPHPEDSYGIAKLAVERELRACREMFGLDYVVFRPHNVYGPRQNLGDRYRNVVGIFMNRLLGGEDLIVFGDGEQERAFTHVTDITPALARAPGIPAARGQVFNLGSDDVTTVNRLAELVMQVMDTRRPVHHVDERLEVRRAFSDHGKFRRVFDPAPTTPLEQGLRSMAAWVRRNGTRKGPRFSDIEIHRNLPPTWA